MEGKYNSKSHTTYSNLIQRSESLYPGFKLVSQRMKSFDIKEWPVGLAQTPEKLASAGFFYTGFGDKVVCFQCGGGMKNWLSDDDPCSEHVRCYPKCMFIQLIKSESIQNSIKNNVTNKDNCTNTDTTPANFDFQKQVASLRSEASYRKPESFSNPKSISSRFFLKKPSIPLKAEVEENNETLKDVFICKLCMDCERSIAFSPCGHLIACKLCATSLDSCPVCRCKISQFLKIFIS